MNKTTKFNKFTSFLIVISLIITTFALSSCSSNVQNPPSEPTAESVTPQNDEKPAPPPLGDIPAPPNGEQPSENSLFFL